jgi:hypothetical protein
MPETVRPKGALVKVHEFVSMNLWLLLIGAELGWLLNDRIYNQQQRLPFATDCIFGQAGVLRYHIGTAEREEKTKLFLSDTR